MTVPRVVSGVVTIAAAVLLGGCASGRPDTGFGKVQSLVADRTGARVQWDGHTADDRAVTTAVQELLSGPLTADAAVQVALLNNRNLQATFEELGIAQADLVQAGLLKNPVFDLSVRIPDRPPSKTYLDMAVTQSFLDAFLIPARRKIAAAQLERAQARVANEVLELAARARATFYDYVAAEQMVELRQSIADAATASLDAAARVRQAGNSTELEYLGERAQAARAKMELANARADAADAREELNALMGAWARQTLWTAANRLPELPAREVRVEGLEGLAVRQRQDLAAARQEVLAQSRVYGLTVDTRFFASADAGVEAERETDGQWKIGPTLSVPIPLFDRGQAAIPRAAAVLRQSEQRYAALAVEIRSQVRAARTRMLNARGAAEFYRSEILPTQQRLLEQTQLQYNGMFVGVFQLLQAKRDQIEAAVSYVNALRTYWSARAELQRAVGGRLPPVEPAPEPATRPASFHDASPTPHSAHGEHHDQ